MGDQKRAAYMKQSIPAECTAIGLIKKASLQPVAATRTKFPCILQADPTCIFSPALCFLPLLVVRVLYAQAQIYMFRDSRSLFFLSAATARHIHQFFAISARNLYSTHWCTVVTVALRSCALLVAAMA